MLHLLFQTPIFIVESCGEKCHELATIAYKEAKEKKHFDAKWQPDNENALSTAANDDQFLVRHRELANIFIDYATTYIRRLGYPGDKPKIVRSWMNEQHKGQLVGWHTHGYKYADIAGVYYIQAEESGILRFKNPIPFLEDFPVIPSDNYICGSKFEVAPKTGNLILFPSWLYHVVTPNNKEAVRVAASFNIKLSRTLAPNCIVT